MSFLFDGRTETQKQQEADPGVLLGEADFPNEPEIRPRSNQTEPVQRFFYGEFDPGSGRTLAACLTHASRAGTSGGVTLPGGERRTGE